MPLTDTKVKNAKPSEKVVKLTDGSGLTCQGRSKLTLLAIKLNLLTFVRSSELRFAR